MKNKGLWVLPGIVLSIPLGWRLYNLIKLFNLRLKYPSNSVIRFFVQESLANFWVNVVTIILVIEIACYYFIRKRLRKVYWVVIHSAMMFVALIIFPALYAQDIFLFYSIVVETWKAVLFCFAPLVIGHLFFILIIVKSFKKIKKERENEPPGLLDEFVS